MSSKNITADDWITALNMQAHPEGGYFAETYRSAQFIARQALPAHYAGDRIFSTAIYFLLKSGQVSRLHRLKSDEIWHWYAGSTATIHILYADGTYVGIQLGQSPMDGALPQAVVPAGVWFGVTVGAADSYTLCGCTVSPGFDFADFELADRAILLAQYQQHQALIAMLTPELKNTPDYSVTET